MESPLFFEGINVKYPRLVSIRQPYSFPWSLRLIDNEISQRSTLIEARVEDLALDYDNAFDQMSMFYITVLNQYSTLQRKWKEKEMELKLLHQKISFKRSIRDSGCYKPLYGYNVLNLLSFISKVHSFEEQELRKKYIEFSTISSLIEKYWPSMSNFAIITHRVKAETPTIVLSQYSHQNFIDTCHLNNHSQSLNALLMPFYEIKRTTSIHFPNKFLTVYDSGKLITLVELLKKLKKNGDRILIYTQVYTLLILDE